MKEKEQGRDRLLDIYIAFFKMGLVTFGGGYAMLPILEREVVEKRSWIEKEEVLDYYAVSQGLPGIITVNVSVFIGYRRRQIPGGLMAALGVVSPCIIIITILAACLQNFQDNVYVKHALGGISVCVTALIASTVLGLFKKGVKDVPGFLIFLAVAGYSLFTPLSPILCVVCAAVLGILIQTVRNRRTK